MAALPPPPFHAADRPVLGGKTRPRLRRRRAVPAPSRGAFLAGSHASSQPSPTSIVKDSLPFRDRSEPAPLSTVCTGSLHRAGRQRAVALPAQRGATAAAGDAAARRRAGASASSMDPAPPPGTPPRPCCLPARCMAISLPLCATSEQTRLSSYQTPLLRGALSRRMNVALRPARYLVAREAAAGLAEVAARHHAHTFNTVKAQIEAEVSPRRDLAASDRDPGVISIPAHAISRHLPPGRGGAKRGAAQGCRDRRRAAIPARLPACIRRSADDVGSRRTCSAARAHQH